MLNLAVDYNKSGVVNAILNSNYGPKRKALEGWFPKKNQKYSKEAIDLLLQKYSKGSQPWKERVNKIACSEYGPSVADIYAILNYTNDNVEEDIAHEFRPIQAPTVLTAAAMALPEMGSRWVNEFRPIQAQSVLAASAASAAAALPEMGSRFANELGSIQTPTVLTAPVARAMISPDTVYENSSTPHNVTMKNIETSGRVTNTVNKRKASASTLHLSKLPCFGDNANATTIPMRSRVAELEPN